MTKQIGEANMGTVNNSADVLREILSSKDLLLTGVVLIGEGETTTTFWMNPQKTSDAEIKAATGDRTWDALYTISSETVATFIRTYRRDLRWFTDYIEATKVAIADVGVEEFLRSAGEAQVMLPETCRINPEEFFTNKENRIRVYGTLDQVPLIQ